MNLSTRTIAPLRGDVQLKSEEHERLPFSAIDKTLGQKVRLDPAGFAVASALTRPWHPPDLLEKIARQGLRMSPQLLVRLIRFFDAHLLLDTPRAKIRIKAETTAVDKTNDVIKFFPGTKHQCVSCGHSCGSHDIGPIDPLVKDSIIEAFPESTFRFRKTDDQESTGYYCGMTDDQCDFLDQKNLCRIHAITGANNKPTDCQLFPLAFTRTPSGVMAGIRMECRSYLESKRAASDEFQNSAAVKALYSRLTWVDEISPLVRVDDLFTTTYEKYETWEPSLIRQINAPLKVIWDGVLAVNQLWSKHLTEAREQDRNGWVFPPEVRRSESTDVTSLLTKFKQACKTAIRLNASCNNVLRVRQLERVIVAANTLIEGKVPHPGNGPDNNELIRDYLIQNIQLKSALKGPSIRFGWAKNNLALLLAAAGAQQTDLNLALADALKVLRTGPVIQCLHDEIDAVTDCFHTHFSERM